MQLPSTLDFLVSTPIGVSCIVFVLTMVALLVIRPPSVKIVSIEGTSLSWLRIIGFSLLAAAAVQIYPLFLMMQGTGSSTNAGGAADFFAGGGGGVNVSPVPSLPASLIEETIGV